MRQSSPVSSQYFDRPDEQQTSPNFYRTKQRCFVPFLFSQVFERGTFAFLCRQLCNYLNGANENYTSNFCGSYYDHNWSEFYQFNDEFASLHRPCRYMTRLPGTITCSVAAIFSSWPIVQTADHQLLGKSPRQRLTQNDSSNASFFHSMGLLSITGAKVDVSQISGVAYQAEYCEQFVEAVRNFSRMLHRFRRALPQIDYSKSHHDSF